jgi:hypothetical protein
MNMTYIFNVKLGMCYCIATGVKNYIKHRYRRTNITMICKIRVANIINIA